MTVDTMSMAVSLLLSQDLHATVEYPGTIHVITGKSELFVFGTVNPMFGADIYRSVDQDAGSPDEAISTDISSDCDDPVLVAETIAKTVDPEGQHSFQCAHCLCILTPGDKVVYAQNSDTGIDVFCSDACKHETDPRTTSVYEYFQSMLGEPPMDDTLTDLPVNTPCGADCLKVIDATAQFRAVCDSSLHEHIVSLANEAVEIFWRG